MSYQFSDIKLLGDNKYFPLTISDIGGAFAEFSRFIFLTNYSEDFDATWVTSERAFGRLNPDYRYVQTNRKISLSFTLPAKNVAEAQENLSFCSQLARTVYGNYKNTGEQTTFGNRRYRFDGARLTTKMKFGNLIRNEFCFFTDFSFAPNFDSGVYEFNDTPVNTEKGDLPIGLWQDVAFNNDSLGELPETSYVYHFNKGDVYPKEINIDISVIVLHGYPLGFGGPLRPGEPLKWAENKNRDWPHGTGPTYPVPGYVSTTVRPSPKTPPSPSQGKGDTMEIDGTRYDIDAQGRVKIISD